MFFEVESATISTISVVDNTAIDVAWRVKGDIIGEKRHGIEVPSATLAHPLPGEGYSYTQEACHAEMKP